MAALFDAAPWFIELQQYKAVMFGVSSAALVLNYWLVVVRPRRCAPGELCHVDTPFMRFNRRLYWVSLALFVAAIVLTYGPGLVVR
jgi:hypothetical protein